MAQKEEQQSMSTTNDNTNIKAEMQSTNSDQQNHNKWCNNDHIKNNLTKHNNTKNNPHLNNNENNRDDLSIASSANSDTHSIMTDNQSRNSTNISIIPRNGSIQSLSSVGSSMSSRQNEDEFIYENEARSTHSSSNIQHINQHENQHRNQLSNDDANDLNDDMVVNGISNMTNISTPKLSVSSGITPSPKRVSPSASPHHDLIINNNHNHNNNGNTVMDQHVVTSTNNNNNNNNNNYPNVSLLSPHITALSKLHTNNLSNKELSPSPRDLQPDDDNDYSPKQHQDIKSTHLEHDDKDYELKIDLNNYSSNQSVNFEELEALNGNYSEQHHQQNHQQNMWNKSTTSSKRDLHNSSRARSSMRAMFNTVMDYLPYGGSSRQTTNDDDKNDPNLTDLGEYTDNYSNDDDERDDEKKEGDIHGSIRNMTDNDININTQNRQNNRFMLHNNNKNYKHTDNGQNNLRKMMQSQEFMSSAYTMFDTLDHTLNNINSKRQQLESLKNKQRRKRKRFNKKIKHNQKNDNKKYSNNAQNNDNDNDNDDNLDYDSSEHDIEEIDVNEHVVGVMKTLLSSTTEMGSFFASSNTSSHRGSGCNSPTKGGGGGGGSMMMKTKGGPASHSMIGRLLDKLSSSIAYMSYISVSTITPFIYNMVEAVLIELYATIKDIIEYYDPDPKNNILWRIINKMTEIIEAIRGLLALSDCFYEISDHDDDDLDDDDDEDYEDDEDEDDDDVNNNNSKSNKSSSYSFSFFSRNQNKQKND